MSWSKARKMELLMYAEVCFDHGTNPFEYIHLVAMQVTADECKDLSLDIANTIYWDVMLQIGTKEALALAYRSQAIFKKTQDKIATVGAGGL
jgi:phosphoribosyl 1,2-cyclic phosphodiesterase